MTSTFSRVRDFNNKAGKLPEVVGSIEYWTSLENQFKRIHEELEETFKALKARDIKGIVDGGADLDVTVSGFNYLTGADYSGVINAVLDNNDLKFTEHLDLAHKLLDDSELDQDKFEIVGNDLNDVTYYSISRKADKKVTKYKDFPEVDLTPFLPEVTQVQVYIADKGAEVPQVVLQFLNDNGINVIENADGTSEQLIEVLEKIGNALISVDVKTGSIENFWIEEEIALTLSNGETDA